MMEEKVRGITTIKSGGEIREIEVKVRKRDLSNPLQK
jgi:hypothetical protein